MSPRVAVRGQLLEWACERTGHGLDAYAGRFPKLADWVSGEAQPTLKQLEAFAKATHTPIGYFFLAVPPDEPVPIPDFRTIAGQPAARPSPDMLEMIYVCQQRQEWYRNFARSMHEEPLAFVGSSRLTDDVVTAAEEIRTTLGFDVAARASMPTWTDALRHFIEQADTAGIMVMCSGVVLNNTTRKLNPEEFRGFAIADDLAPLVFINGADTKAAQMFTLAHELAHIWLGQSAVSDAEAASIPQQEVERWCNQVAAELLVPLATLQREYDMERDTDEELNRLARRFKVSTLVILRRMFDVGGLSREQLRVAYARELARLMDIVRSSGGGNFYLTQSARVSKRFARALVVSTWEGRSSFTEAFRLLGVKKMATFRGMSKSLGMSL